MAILVPSSLSKWDTLYIILRPDPRVCLIYAYYIPHYHHHSHPSIIVRRHFVVLVVTIGLFASFVLSSEFSLLKGFHIMYQVWKGTLSPSEVEKPSYPIPHTYLISSWPGVGLLRPGWQQVCIVVNHGQPCVEKSVSFSLHYDKHKDTHRQTHKMTSSNVLRVPLSDVP